MKNNWIHFFVKREAFHAILALYGLRSKKYFCTFYFNVIKPTRTACCNEKLCENLVKSEGL